MKTSEQIKNISAALSKAQTGFEKLSKNTQGYGYKYAELADLIASIQPSLNENGITFCQTPAQVGDSWICVTRLMHESGEWIEGTVPMLFAKSKNAMQELGSAFTYARRYGLQGLAGIASEDDDGASSGPRQDNRRPRNSAPEPAPQQYPSIQSSKLASIMDWKSVPPLVGLLKELAERAEHHSNVDAKTVISFARDEVGKRFKAVGGSLGGDFTQAQAEAMSAVGKLEECDDLVALCNLADLLHVEA